jgi:hypothetical protein
VTVEQRRRYNAACWRRLYHRRRREHLCTNCGAKLPPGWRKGMDRGCLDDRKVRQELRRARAAELLTIHSPTTTR